VSRKAQSIHQGLPSRSSISNMLVMERQNQASGQKICRGITNQVNVRQTKPIVSMAVSEHYYVLARSPSANPGMTDDDDHSFRIWIVLYWVNGVWRSLLERGLPGLIAATLIALVHSGAHAQQADAAGPEAWVGETGTASYYGHALQGRRTAAGTRFDPNELTAAHPWLPFGSRVSVTLQDTGRSVVVTITDRLYSARRVIDLSMAAARLLGMARQGVATVSLSPA
jgi:rare lipoprotein A